MCRAKAKCGWCASETNSTKEHASDDKSKYRCSNCKGNHAAFSKDYKVHKREVDKGCAETKRLQFEPLFPVSPTLTPSVSERGSRNQTPRDGSPRPITPEEAPAGSTPEEDDVDIETVEVSRTAETINIEETDSETEMPEPSQIFKSVHQLASNTACTYSIPSPRKDGQPVWNQSAPYTYYRTKETDEKRGP
jgi:hypothetical protein